MTKDELRRQIIRKRAKLTEEYWQAASESICHKFFQHIDLRNVETIHTFLPITEKREPNTWLIIKKLWQEYTSIQVVSSKTLWKQRELKHFTLSENTEIRNNNWGIPEPEGEIESPHTQFDIVLVPLLAFDTQGDRLGYGGGFYDRFLAKANPETLRVGVSIFSALENPLPERNKFDIPLTHCISPDNFYNFLPSA